jgi:hypothetical protein
MTSPYPRALALTLLLAGLGLSGCGGSMNFPDAVSAVQHQGPPVHGSVYGGHAPIVGSHVYMLQPGTTGYGSPAKSLLQPGTPGVTADTSDPNVPVGSGYVTTDSTGSFYISSYTCTVDHPVFLYSYGGTTSALTTTYVSTSEAINQIVVTGAQPNVNGDATYTVTIPGVETIGVGQSATITGLTGNLSIINGSQTITAASTGTNTSTFTFSATDVYNTYPSFNAYDTVANGTYTATTGPAGNSQFSNPGTGPYGNGGSASVPVKSTTPPANPITQLATLGVCPSSGNFNGVLNFVYMNEVSTVATAYTFQPYTLASNNTAWDIGTSGTFEALIGIDNAVLTAGQLYSIQGTQQISSTQDGEGHIANYQTQVATTNAQGLTTYTPNAGTGVVPQATIDSLANILAACIDSTPTATGYSNQCTTLFNTATDGGSTVASGDTAATDTATAAINIARYPAGNSSGTPDPTYVTDLYTIPTGTVPYAPNLNQAPHDWTLVINYPFTAEPGYPNATNPNFERAESIEVDDIGQIWVTSQQGAKGPNITRVSNLGVPNITDTFGYIPGYVSLDGSNNAWTGNANSTSPIYEAGSNGVFTAKYGSGYQGAYVVITDKAGDVFTFAKTATTGNNFQMFEYPAGSTTSTAATQINISPNVINATDNVGHGAIDASGDLWITSETSHQMARITPSGSSVFPVITATAQPEFPAIDSAGNAWLALQAATSELNVISPSGALSTLTSGTTGAELTSTFGTAVDGNGNVWYTNGCGNFHLCGSTTAGVNTLFVINGANQKAISPSTNYVPEAQYGTNASSTTLTPLLYDPLNIAIDSSGNVWVTNYIGNEVVEVVGAAAPVVTPLSLAAGTGKLGQKP